MEKGKEKLFEVSVSGNEVWMTYSRDKLEEQGAQSKLIYGISDAVIEAIRKDHASLNDFSFLLGIAARLLAGVRDRDAVLDEFTKNVFAFARENELIAAEHPEAVVIRQPQNTQNFS